MKRILIAGCGYVGNELGERLSSQGHEVWGIKREINSIHPSIQSISADLSKKDTLQILPKDIDYVFYMPSPGVRKENVYNNVFLKGIRNLVECIEEKKYDIKKIFFISSTSVYAQNSGEWIDENSSTKPKSSTAKIILQTENYLLNNYFKTTIVRFSGIYGPGRTGFLNKMINDGKTFSHNRFTNRIHRDDCANALIHLMNLPNSENIYLVSDNEPTDLSELAKWIIEKKGFENEGLKYLTKIEFDKTKSNKRCLNKKLIDSGYKFLFPSFREGYKTII
ncbi:MAG: NAD-dependent epimerase/dehydratase family protein [bacterium]